MSKWQRFLPKLPQHKYAIQAKLLGDDRALAWTNLGDWSVLSPCGSKPSYPQACESLAHGLAQALTLNSKDRVLDLGCGQGASLQLWQQHYAVQNLEAVELQTACVQQIQQHLPHLNAIHELDFLNLNQFEFKSFDVVMCLDAAYHTNLNSFLTSVKSVLNSKARIGFHTLIWSDEYLNSNFFSKQRYHFLLKAADVNSRDVLTQVQLEQTLKSENFVNIQIQDLSEAVLKGFADYVEHDLVQDLSGVDGLKIAMTAKLCRKLYKDGLLRYVQVTAHQGI